MTDADTAVVVVGFGGSKSAALTQTFYLAN